MAILVAVLLPLQLAWGVAASYCQHETSALSARHFGHHTHVHEAGTHEAGTSVAGKLERAKAEAANDASNDAASFAAKYEATKYEAPEKPTLKLQIDADCSFCHASASGVLPELDRAAAIRVLAQPPVQEGDLGHPSAPQRLPERPQWPRLA